MGLQGHSFAGFETNYVITHSHRFAAAAEFAGLSDVVSASGHLWGYPGHYGGSMGWYFDVAAPQFGLGGDLWERQQSYIENSPVLKADAVTTPLLMTHAENDTQVPWEQAVEFYLALRRCGKPVWMLQYYTGHQVSGQDAEDYTVRLTQFFDHYLKGAPAPLWMTDGVSAEERDRAPKPDLKTSRHDP
jgi:dipeptidyl aminopeptidase/acylaminoacyl peptidase